ncbi:MAG TPA: response regulator transcription factor [Thermoanaerobaculia bacterium]|jgi:DNA-binding NarL/FixJ family response regulator|nr:response regulator transcription factor [Thermoanaerobaculia bacterium]
MIETTPIRVIIIEDDRGTRDGLRLLVDGTPGYRCLAAFASLEQVQAARGGEPPDVVLLDIMLPGEPGSRGVAALRERWPAAAVLMLTAFEDEDKIFESLCNGATGYLLKRTPPARLLEAVREARDGGAPMSPEIARKVVELFRRTAPPVALQEALTPQEVQLLRLLAEGCSYQTAGGQLGISINTVRNYIRNVYEKLQVHTKSAAVSKAMRAGLL